MNKDRHGFSYHTLSGWPALLVIAVLIVGVLYLTLWRHDPATRLKPATGTARAMALAAEGNPPAQRAP